MPNHLIPTPKTPPDTPHTTNPARVYLASLRSANSRRNMRRYLDQIANGVLSDTWLTPRRSDFDHAEDYAQARDAYGEAIHVMRWDALRSPHVTAIVARLSEAYSPATVNVMLSALRGTLKTAWTLDLMTAEDYQKAASVKNVKHTTLPTGRDLANHEVLALLATCHVNADERGAKDTRDAAIIALLWATGMRRSELAGLRYQEYDRDTGEIKIMRSKGNKDRAVYIDNVPRLLLERWLAVRGDHDGDLFERIRRGDHVVAGHGITAQAVYNILKHRGAEAGLTDFTPHDFRRTTIGEMLDRGVDMSTVANVVGHASTDTTKRYDRRGKRALKDAAGKMDLSLL